MISWIVGSVLSYAALWWQLVFFVSFGWDGEARKIYALALFVSYAVGALVGAIAIIGAQPSSQRLYLIAAATAMISAVATGYASRVNARDYVQVFSPAPVPGFVASVVMCAAIVGRDRWICGGKRFLAAAQEGTTSIGGRMALGRPTVARVSAGMFLLGYLTIQLSNSPENLLFALTAGVISVFLAIRAFPNLLAIVVAIMSGALVAIVLSGL